MPGQKPCPTACAAYHPEEAVRRLFADRLDLLEHVPGGAPDVNQDAVLLRRPVEESASA